MELTLREGGGEWRGGEEVIAEKVFPTLAHFESPVTTLTMLLTMLGGLMSSFRMFDSVASG